jgi:hypothetical protein
MMQHDPPKYISFEAPKEMLATQENIHINLRHTTMKIPPVDQPAHDVALALDAQLQKAVSSSQNITVKIATAQVMSE